jgi:hypothetical protein
MSIAPGYRGTDVIARENELRMNTFKEALEPKLDSVVTTIIEQFTSRAKMGKAKYGVDLDRTDLTLVEWIEHAKQEHMDAILYLEKIKQIVQLNELQEKVI